MADKLGEKTRVITRDLTEKLTTKMMELGCYVFENDHFLQNLRAKNINKQERVLI